MCVKGKGGGGIGNFQFLLAFGQSDSNQFSPDEKEKKKKSGTKGMDGPRRGAEEKPAIFGSIHSPPLRKPAWREI